MDEKQVTMTQETAPVLASADFGVASRAASLSNTQDITTVTEVSTINSTDQFYMNQSGKIVQVDYSKLADAILGKITSKDYTLDQGTKTLVEALNELNSKSFFTRGGIALTSESDFNNYTDFGNYYCARTSDVSLIKNKPKGLFGAFSMKIFAGNGTSYPTQQVTDLDGNMWIRSFVENEWRAWSQFSRVKDS